MKANCQKKFDSIAVSSHEGFLPNIHYKNTYSQLNVPTDNSKKRNSLIHKPFNMSTGQALLKSNDFPDAFRQSNFKIHQQIIPFKK